MNNSKDECWFCHRTKNLAETTLAGGRVVPVCPSHRPTNEAMQELKDAIAAPFTAVAAFLARKLNRGN